MRKESDILIATDPLPKAISCGKTEFGPNERHITRMNDGYVLIFVCKNELYFTEDGEEVSLSEGNWYIQFPGKMLGSRRPSPYAWYYYIQFSAGESVKTGDAIILPSRGVWRQELLLPLLSGLEKSSCIREQYLMKQSVFLRLLQYLVEDSSGFPEETAHIPEQILDFVDYDECGRLTGESLEREFHYTYDYLRRIFMKKYGITPIRYSLELRNSRAKKLLTMSDKSVSDIAKQLGFAGVFAFSKMFRRENGCSPTEWRAKSR